MVGAITNDKMGKTIFLTEISIGAAVMSIRFLFFIWNQNGIYDLANRVCVFSIQDEDDYATFNNKLIKFAKLVGIYLTLTVFGAVLSAVVIPLVGTENTLFLEIGFPLDWKNSDIAFWIAITYLTIQIFISVVVSAFTIIIWYLLFICSLRYEVLGSVLKNMGHKKTKKVEENHINFLEDLKTSIGTHLYLME